MPPRQSRTEIDMTPSTQKTQGTTAPAADTMPIKTSHLAKRFNIKATALRRVLRSMPEYADGVHTNYRWAENDKRIDAIGKKLAEVEQQRKDRKLAAQAALKAKEAEAVKQAATDKAHGVKA